MPTPYRESNRPLPPPTFPTPAQVEARLLHEREAELRRETEKVRQACYTALCGTDCLSCIELNLVVKRIEAIEPVKQDLESQGWVLIYEKIRTADDGDVFRFEMTAAATNCSTA